MRGVIFMALTNDDLLAISQLLDTKLKHELQPIKNDIRDIKLDIENTIKPQIRLLAENYIPAAKRYEKMSDCFESGLTDVNLLKKVVADHSKILQQLS